MTTVVSDTLDAPMRGMDAETWTDGMIDLIRHSDGRQRTALRARMENMGGLPDWADVDLLLIMRRWTMLNDGATGSGMVRMAADGTRFARVKDGPEADPETFAALSADGPITVFVDHGRALPDRMLEVKA